MANLSPTNIAQSSQAARQSSYWRLIYSDGVTLDEPLTGGSILNAWSDAVELHVMYRSIQLQRFALEGARPIWYRKYAAGIHAGSLVKPDAGSRLIVTVFGVAREILAGNSEAMERSRRMTLWAFYEGASQIIGCPDSLVELAVIERQLTEPLQPRKAYGA